MTTFDPYYKWLGIPTVEQPPNHYRLLGINLFESDPDVIEMAADQRMAHVRSLQSSQHSALSQKLLNELTVAKICFLRPEKKAAYDATLRATLQGPPPFPPAPLGYCGSPPPQKSGASVTTQAAASGPLDFLSSDEHPVFRKNPDKIKQTRQNPRSSLAIMLSLVFVPIVGIVFVIIVSHNSDVGDEPAAQPVAHSAPVVAAAGGGKAATPPRAVIETNPVAYPVRPTPADVVIGSKSAPNDGSNVMGQPTIDPKPITVEREPIQVEPKPIQVEAKPIPVEGKPIPVEAKVLAAAFQDNADAAAQKWIGRPLELKGTVKEKLLNGEKGAPDPRELELDRQLTLDTGEKHVLTPREGSDKGPIVLYDSGDKRFIVRCHFAASEKSNAAMESIKVSGNATIDGTCIGYSDNTVQEVPNDGGPAGPVHFGIIDIESCQLVTKRAVNQSTASALEGAEAARKETLASANETLLKSFDYAVNEVSATGDLDATKAVIAERDRFGKGVFPRSKAMAAYMSDYAERRAGADRALIEAYDEAESDYTKQLKMDEAASIRKEKVRFAATEAKFMEPFRAAKQEAEPEATSKGAVDTGGYLKSFSERLHNQIDAIAKLETSAKRDDAHATMIHSLDEELQKKTLTLRFPIKDVQHAYQSQYTFLLSQPDEVAGIKGQSSFMGSMTLEFPPAETAKIKPGDLFIVSGTSRLKSTQGGYSESIQGAVSPVQLQSDVSKTTYNIYLQNYKVRIEHK